jgi:hypothetical protein
MADQPDPTGAVDVGPTAAITAGPLSGPVGFVPALRVHEDGQVIEFTFQAILDYHGRLAPAGVAHAFKVMELGFPLLDPDTPVERREIAIETAFAGPGARDAFEMVTRAVTGDRYRVNPVLAQPDRGLMVGDFVFHLRYRDRLVRLRLRPGHLSEEFVALARTTDPTPSQAERLAALKLEMADRLMVLDPTEVYEQVG